ncbi:MAG: hypothetical protein HY908_13750 [Myxococcales bacterium]|nr:hypothetical protein [Myxococcales bacterium]
MCLEADERAVAFGVGVDTVCVALVSGAVKCFGAASFRYGGNGKPDVRCGSVHSIPLGGGRRALAIASSEYRTCVVLDDGRVKCWSGIYGGPSEAVEVPYRELGTHRRARSVAVGRGSDSCALLDDGHVVCWGADFSWGGGPPVPDIPNEIDLGTGRTAAAIVSGRAHVCAILDTGEVKCWGDSDAVGHCPRAQCVDPSGSPDTCAVHRNYWIGDEPAEMGDALVAVPLPGRARTLAAGGVTCAILEDGSPWCWGKNRYGELGIGEYGRHPCCVPGPACGLRPVQLGIGRTARLVAVGSNHVCAVLDNEELKCWGRGGPWLGAADGDDRDRGGTPDTIPALLPAIDVGE